MDSDNCDKERRKKVGRTWEKILGETLDLNPVSGGRNGVGGVTPSRTALKGTYLQYDSHHILTARNECRQGNTEMKQVK